MSHLLPHFTKSLVNFHRMKSPLYLSVRTKKTNTTSSAGLFFHFSQKANERLIIEFYVLQLRDSSFEVVATIFQTKKKIEMFNFEKKTLMEKEKGRRKFPTTLITIINVRVVGLVAAVMITWKL